MTLFNQNPSTLPTWPAWEETPTGITLRGRHRTPRTACLAGGLAQWTGSLLVVHSFFFSYSPLNRALAALLGFFNPTWTVDQMATVVYFANFIPGLLIGSGGTPLMALLVRRTLCIRFSAHWIDVPRKFHLGWRRFDRSLTEQLEFFVTHHQGAQSYGQDGKQNTTPPSTTNGFDAYMRFGWNEVLLGEFVDEKKANGLILMCRAASLESQGKPATFGFPVLAAQPVAEALPAVPERVLVRRRDA